MKNEVDKLQALSGGKVDWGAVAAGADELLSEKSKDFRVALYYATAQAHTDGLSGLLDGFVVLNELCAPFWEAMYPSLKRPEGARQPDDSGSATWSAPQFQAFVPTANDADTSGHRAGEHVARRGAARQARRQLPGHHERAEPRAEPGGVAAGSGATASSGVCRGAG